MSELQSSLAIWLFVAVQVFGLTSAWLAKLSEGSIHQTHCQLLFFGCLTLVGLGTIVALRAVPGLWLMSAATLSIMVLAVTCDFRHRVEA